MIAANWTRTVLCLPKTPSNSLQGLVPAEVTTCLVAGPTTEKIDRMLLILWPVDRDDVFGRHTRFDKFIDIFNNERPHEDYPVHDKTIVVTRCGRICIGKKKINFSRVFAGPAVGIKEVHDDIWLVSFMEYDLVYFDLEEKTRQPLDNPFGPKV